MDFEVCLNVCDGGYDFWCPVLSIGSWLHNMVVVREYQDLHECEEPVIIECFHNTKWRNLSYSEQTSKFSFISRITYADETKWRWRYELTSECRGKKQPQIEIILVPKCLVYSNLKNMPPNLMVLLRNKDSGRNKKSEVMRFRVITKAKKAERFIRKHKWYQPHLNW